MKNQKRVLMAGIAVLVLASSQAMAAFYEVNVEEDMAEGITLSVENESRSKEYKYDNSLPGPEEFMTEAIFFPQAKKVEIRYAGDPSVPSLANLMAEGICIEDPSKFAL